MKYNYFFVLFVFSFQLISTSLFETSSHTVPPEITLHILKYCSPLTLLNVRSSNKENREFMEGYLEEKYVGSQKISHFFWEIFVETNKKEKHIPIFVKQLCLKYFKDIIPDLAYFYPFSDIRNMQKYEEINNSYSFSILEDDKRIYFSFLIKNSKCINNYHYFELNTYDDLEILLKFKPVSKNDYLILKINYHLESLDFSWLMLFIKEYTTLLVQFPECAYPPIIAQNKTKLLDLFNETKIVVPKNEILLYGINGLRPWLPQFLQNEAILYFLNQNSTKNRANYMITTNWILHYLYSSRYSCPTIDFLRFLFLNPATLENLIGYIKRLNNNYTTCSLVSFNLNQLFSAYHHPVHLLRGALEYLKTSHSYSDIFLKILKRNIVRSKNDALILDLYFFSPRTCLLKHIHNKVTLEEIFKRCVIKNYENYKKDLLKSGIYLRLFFILMKNKKYKHACKQFKKDALAYFPLHSEFYDQLHFHEVMLQKKSIRKKIVHKIFNNLLAQKLSTEKCVFYKKLFKQYYRKIK